MYFAFVVLREPFLGNMHIVREWKLVIWIFQNGKQCQGIDKNSDWLSVTKKLKWGLWLSFHPFLFCIAPSLFLQQYVFLYYDYGDTNLLDLWSTLWEGSIVISMGWRAPKDMCICTHLSMHIVIEFDFLVCNSMLCTHWKNRDFSTSSLHLSCRRRSVYMGS